MRNNRAKNIMAMAVCLGFVLSTSCKTPDDWAKKYAENNPEQFTNPQMGWQVLQDDYRENVAGQVDGLSLEWDYYSIHDDLHKFTGIIGYLVADPDGDLGGESSFMGLQLMPSGGNLAINGRWKGADGEYSIDVDYRSFGQDFQAGKDERYWYASNDAGEWGLLEPEGEEGMHLAGETEGFAWDLHVTQKWGHGDWPNYDVFPQTYEVGSDVDMPIPSVDEHWTVNPLWLTTNVSGQMTHKATNETTVIDGHGYRENSFGRWIFIAGGWDFYFHSDPVNQVGLGFQTYHYNTEDLDFMDITFMDNGVPKGVRFMAKDDELGWEHGSWEWNQESRQAVPRDIVIVGKNQEYTVEVHATIVRDEDGREVLDYTPMLSDVTVITDLYVIQCLYPTYSGVITRNNPDGSTNENDVVTTFGGIGGGEFSAAKSIFDDLDPDFFDWWLGDTYSHPFPQ